MLQLVWSKDIIRNIVDNILQCLKEELNRKKLIINLWDLRKLSIYYDRKFTYLKAHYNGISINTNLIEGNPNV